MSSPENNGKAPRARQPARVLVFASNVVWWSLLVMLVLLALYAGIGRQLSTQIDRWTDQLSDELSEQTALTIHIRELRSSWDWLDPTVTATGIDVVSPDTGERIAFVEHLTIGIDFWASLSRWRLVFEAFEADGVALTVIRPVSDLGAQPVDVLADLNDNSQERLQTWIRLAGQWLSDPQVRITRIRLAIGSDRDHLRHVDIPQLDLIYRRGLFQASGRAMQPGSVTQLASFALVGQHFFQGDFTGQLYLEVDSGRLFDGLVDDLVWQGLRVEGFDLGGRAWLTFQQGAIIQVQGRVRTPYLQLGAGQQSIAPLENIQANFGWRQGQAMHLRQLQWRWQGESITPFSLRVQPQDGGVSVVADELPLRPLRRLIQSLSLLPHGIARALEQYRPSGYLDRMHLVVPDQPEAFRVSGQLRDFGVDAWGGTPSIDGLDGRLQMTAGYGFVEIDTRDSARLGFPALFASDWTFNAIRGRVAWQRNDTLTRVYSDGIDFDYAEDTGLTGAFDLKMRRYGEDELGLKVGIERGDASMLVDFIPARVVDPALYDWLTGNISEAIITAGEYYGHGRIDRAAPGGSFVSSMWFEFEQARIQYDPQWPPLEQGSGRVEIHGADTRVDLTAGQVGGLAVAGAQVRVEPGADLARVKVDVSSEIAGRAVPRWLANTPLGDWSGLEADTTRYGGLFGLDLNLDIPLAEGSKPGIRAKVTTDNGAFALPGTNLAWTDIRADLTYDSRTGFSGEPIRAEFIGQPVEVQFAQPDGALEIRQSGRLVLSQLWNELNLATAPVPGLSGELTYTAGLRIAGDEVSPISVESELRGLTLDWPSSLGKSAGQSAPVSATIHPGVDEGVRIEGEWQDRARFDFLWKSNGFDLTLDYLQLGNQRLLDTRLSALDLGNRWVVNTESARALGRIELPDGDEAIQVDLQRLRLLRSGDDAPPDVAGELLTLQEQVDAFRQMEVGNWPDVDVRITELQVNDEYAGQWQFAIRPLPNRLTVQDIKGRFGTLELAGNLIWTLVDNRENTRFQGTLSGGPVNELEALLGSDMPLENQKTNIELDIDWPGRPDSLELAQLNGTVSARLDDGVILKQNNTAQLFRVFNLLNTDTLWRRLRLDFSDLYERGVAFDAISGKAQIINGLVTLDPELQLVGPSGAFKLSGTTNMADETLDMRLVLVLPVTQNLPLAAILMGASAPIGGALFVLDKILGDPLSRLTSATYSVTGSWSEPDVDLQSVFDTGE
ncbi:MAG TPA: AsmA-like C-terminal region-containing protein [Marinobacter sp.]|nr:AsmA-like C-terminal region-containing protein [Marinobacter sp.]